ncbi:WbqC family protein [Methylobacter sp.]|uniref:WbqC family protein n=1 Tax=Methylobacter sp. TaxID=2051955 RepID=UPI003DA619F2
MIVTIMQPYLFPYIGYFQLLECSDIFVVGDDVQYIKGGWINRNRILVNQEPCWLTFPVQGDSADLPINQRHYVESQNVRSKILRRIECAYRKTPYFKDIYPVIADIMSFGSSNVSEFNTNAIRRLASLLNIQCRILVASELEKDNSLKCQDRVIETNRCVGSSHYINPIGGMALYKERDFLKFGIELSFIRSDAIHYHQFAEPFVPSLSIIDVLMFCPLDEIRKFLKQYQLLKFSDSKILHFESHEEMIDDRQYGLGYL